MSQVKSDRDSRFVSQVLFASTLAEGAILLLVGSQELVWWQSLLLGWVWFGLLSAMIELVGNFHNIKIESRAETLSHFAVSVAFGPVSLVGTLWLLHRRGVPT